jgi:3-methylfumaryl-CoA hydratase
MTDLGSIAETWRPAAVAVTGPIEVPVTRKLAALLGVPSPGIGDELPPLWHEVQLRAAVGVDELGADGHPRAGALLPPLPQRRRMFGGATLERLGPLRVGDDATRTAQVVDVRVREGRSGTLLLVTEEHLWSVAGTVRLRERRDLVYRAASDVGTPERPADQRISPVRERVADERYLFAYSALTYNLHRIHYDDRYAREVEGHPALVVHGPLLALWCAEHARQRPGPAPTRLAYRLTAPAYVGEAVGIASIEQDDGLTVEATSRGRTCVRMLVS